MTSALHWWLLQKNIYHMALAENVHLPNCLCHDPIDQAEHDDIYATVNGMTKATKVHGRPNNHDSCLKHILWDHMNTFHLSFLSSPETRLLLLKFELTYDSMPVKIRLRMYSQIHQKDTKTLVDILVLRKIASLNHTSNWPVLRF